jgi:hypothetical protein
MTTLVTFPDQLMPFRPGFSTGKSPDMWSFIKAVPRYASFREQSSTMPVVISVSSTIVVPIMSVISPEPVSVMSGSE